VRLAKVAALRAQGRLPEAIREARSARDGDPRLEEPHVVLSGLLAEAGMYEASLDALRAASALSGQAAARHAGRIEALRQEARARADKLRDDAAPGPRDRR
jgi:hypothetical protein